MPKQVDKYDKERLDILNKIFSILGLGESNNKFSLHKLDNDIEKQKAIIDLEGDIKKYFICGNWSCFRDNQSKRKWLSMIRYLLKNHNYNISSRNKKDTNSDSPSEIDTIYTITRNII